MSITITIPGGEATFLNEQSEMTARRERDLNIISARLGTVLPALQKAGRILLEGDVQDDRTDVLNEDGSRVFDGPDVDLTEQQFRLLMRMSDALVYGLLKSWTLPIPLPGSPDEVQDLPAGLYEFLKKAAAQINAGRVPAGFDVDDAIPDDGTPADTSVPTSA